MFFKDLSRKFREDVEFQFLLRGMEKDSHLFVKVLILFLASKSILQKQKKQEQYQRNLEKFFGCTEQDWKIREE